MKGLRLCLLAFFLLWPLEAGAHAFSRSLSSWHVEENSAGDYMMRVVFLAPIIAAESIPYGDPSLSAEERFAEHLSKNIRLSLDGMPCALTPLQVKSWRRSQLRAEGVFQCPRALEGKSFKAQITAFFDSDSSHVHFARFFWRDKILEQLFSDKTRHHALSLDEEIGLASGSAGAVFLAYIPIGIEHILSGLDHLAFLAALLLICQRLRLIFWAITGFTLGHSLTLGLAAAGVLAADSNLIEALIGFTVLLVALEGVALTGKLRRPYWLLTGSLAGFFLLSFFVPAALSPIAWAGLFIFTLFWGLLVQDGDNVQRFAPLLSVLFGLIHGFGFASVLTEVGLSEESLLPALAGFNIGVEIGQLVLIALFIAVVWGARRIFMRSDFARRRRRHALWDDMPHFASSLLVGLGVYWFIGRAFL